MKKTNFIIFVGLICALTTFAQDKPVLHSWRGLTIDVTTSLEAVEKLGKPAKDRPKETFLPLVYSKWFGNEILKFRRLTFNKIEGFDDINLYFSSSDKLLIIEMDMKKDLSASALVDAYDAKFYPLVGNYENGITPGDLVEGKREIIYPKYFPASFTMAAATDKTIGLAFASQGFAETFAAGLARPGIKGTAAVSSSLNGLVRKIQLISRTLENKKGVDLLK